MNERAKNRLTTANQSAHCLFPIIMQDNMKFVTFLIVILFAKKSLFGVTNEVNADSVKETVLAIFRNHGQNLCPGTDVCLSNRSDLLRTRGPDNWAACCTGKDIVNFIQVRVFFLPLFSNILCTKSYIHATVIHIQNIYMYFHSRLRSK